MPIERVKPEAMTIRLETDGGGRTYALAYRPGERHPRARVAPRDPSFGPNPPSWRGWIAKVELYDPSVPYDYSGGSYVDRRGMPLPGTSMGTWLNPLPAEGYGWLLKLCEDAGLDLKPSILLAEAEDLFKVID